MGMGPPLPQHLSPSSLYQQSSSPSSPVPSCSSGTTIGSSYPGDVRKWKQRRDKIRPSSFPRVRPIYVHSGSPRWKFFNSDKPNSAFVPVCFEPDSVDARRKDAQILLRIAHARLPAPQTSHHRLAGHRRASAASACPPTLQAPRFQGTPAGHPAPCDAPRQQLVPRPVEPVLGLRAVHDHPARRVVALDSRLSRARGHSALIDVLFITSSYRLALCLCVCMYIIIGGKFEHTLLHTPHHRAYGRCPCALAGQVPSTGAKLRRRGAGPGTFLGLMSLATCIS
jgi:hypothetical protein